MAGPIVSPDCLEGYCFECVDPQCDCQCHLLTRTWDDWQDAEDTPHDTNTQADMALAVLWPDDRRLPAEETT